MPLNFIIEDIVTLKVDAIVNAANHQLAMGGGVCGAIFRAADPLRLQSECRRIGACETGEAVITGGCNLPAKKIIHTVGPVWQGGQSGEPEALAGCYSNSLALATKHGLRTVAFPLISSGVFGYPRYQAAMVAVEAISRYLTLDPDLKVSLVIFGPKEDFLEPDLAGIFKNLPRADQAEQFDNPVICSSKIAETITKFMTDKRLGLEALAVKSNLSPGRVTRVLNGEDPDRLTMLALSVGLEFKEAEIRKYWAGLGLNAEPAETINKVVFYFVNQEKFNINFINLNLFALGCPIMF
jgi:O-acetyl-ADP-ribose deacetylase (regulator of RNase III)